MISLYKALVWKFWTSQKVVLSDKLLGLRRYLTPLAGSPVNHIRGPIVKPLMPPFTFGEVVGIIFKKQVLKNLMKYVFIT